MNVFPLQEGGKARSAHGADTACMFPAPEFICPDPENGIKGTCFNSPTAAHRGHPHFVNNRLIDFSEWDKCDSGCEPYYPLHCLSEEACSLDFGDNEGWQNQLSVWEYYYRAGAGCDRFGVGPDSIHANLVAGDRLDLVILSAQEINECVNFELKRAIEVGTAQLRLKCSDEKIGDPIDLSEVGFCDYWDLTKAQQPDKCIAWDILQLEILSFPEVPEDPKCGDECKGKLHKLAFNVGVSGRAKCTGK